jgi:nickel/cobalt transporter (NicO) family protein
MRRLLTLGSLFLLISAETASAHPLGNFTINHFARVMVAGDTLYIRYVVDMAEIPTLQGVRPAVSGLSVKLDGAPVALRRPLRVVREAVTHPRGAAGLRTTRYQVILVGPRVHRSTRIEVVDHNYPGRIGWREIVVGANTTSASDELRAYPKDLLQSPLDVTSVSATVGPTSDPPPTLLTGKAATAPDRVSDSGYASLVARDNLSLLVVLASLGLAVFWGAVHALSPGHGKSIISAYLIGSRGTPWHAVLLGLITTATHTVGVFALGGITLLLSQWIVPETLYPWINLAAGLLVVVVGASVLVRRARYAHVHVHVHAHAHAHAHHYGDQGHSRSSLIAVGVSGGLLPCPSALVVLLAAITLHRVAFGMLLVLAFSVGLAVSITLMGLIAVYAKRVFARFDGRGRVMTLLPAASAVVILLAGLAMTARALPHIGT